MAATGKSSNGYSTPVAIFGKTNDVYSAIAGMYAKQGGQYVRQDNAFEALIAPQTYVTPTADFGPTVTVGGVTLDKYVIDNTTTNFGYYLSAPKTIEASSVNLSGANSSSTAQKLVGYLVVPADIAWWSPETIVDVKITADGTLQSSQISIGSSANLKLNQIITKSVNSDYASTELQMKVKLTRHSNSWGDWKAEQVDPATAPTSYPTASGVIDVNLLGNVKLPIYVKFNAVRTSPMVSVTNLQASILVNPPAVTGATGPFRDPKKEPYQVDGSNNLPNSSSASFRKPYPLIMPAGGNGTVIAVGVAGQDVITGLAGTSNIKVGDFVVRGEYENRGTAATNQDATVGGAENRSSIFLGATTTGSLGYRNRVIAIVSSTSIQLEKPLVSSFTLTKGTTEKNNTLWFAPDMLDFGIRGYEGAAADNKTWYTGFSQTYSDTLARAAFGWSDGIPVYYASTSDPVWEFRVTKVVAPYGFIFDNSNSTITESGESFNAVFKIRAPLALITPTSGTGNAAHIQSRGNTDRNVIIVSEDGRYSIELIYTSFNSTYVAASYGNVRSNFGSYVPYQLDRPEKATNGVSLGTRANGGGTFGLLITNDDIARIPDYSLTTGESDATILARLDQAAEAINHPLAILLSPCQMRGPKFCPDPAVQSGATFYRGFIGQSELNKPSITSGGSVTVGQTLYAVGGDFDVPMKIVPTAVVGGGSTGVMSDFFITDLGMYRSVPSDVSALAFNTRTGVSSGVVLNCINLPGNSSVTTAAQAFPNFTKNHSYTFPAAISDSGSSSNYNGPVPMGQKFILDPTMDLRSEWLAKRKAQPSAYSSSYEFYAVCCAYQRWGGYVVDVAAGNSHVMVFDAFVNTQRIALATGTTGSGVRLNCLSLKACLTATDNWTPQGHLGGTPLAPSKLPLPPVRG